MTALPAPVAPWLFLALLAVLAALLAKWYYTQKG